MNLDEFQAFAFSTDISEAASKELLAPIMNRIGTTPVFNADAIEALNKTKRLLSISYAALGLASEAGEYAGKAKKLLRGDCELEDVKTSMASELGDCLWCIARAASTLNMTLEDVAALNMEKIVRRTKNGTI